MILYVVSYQFVGDSFKDLVREFINEPDKITMDDFNRLLEALGYTLRKKPGSHATYHKKGAPPITAPTPHKGKCIKSPYIKIVVKILKLEDYLDGE